MASGILRRLSICGGFAGANVQVTLMRYAAARAAPSEGRNFGPVVQPVHSTGELFQFVGGNPVLVGNGFRSPRGNLPEMPFR